MATSRYDSSELDAVLAGADLSAKVFYLANLDSSGELILAVNTGRVVGVITEGAVEGKAATYQTGGIAKVLVGSGGLTAGQNVMSNANGEAVLAAGAGTHVVGVALKTAAAGTIGEVLLQANRLHS